jgi:2-dehydro-3-deoxyphosphooctonate aldolase (KDO 8-P synthase)
MTQDASNPLNSTHTFRIGNVPVGGANPLVFLAGPCVIESESHVLHMAENLQRIAERLAVPLVFKASYDKANRTSVHSFRGPGLEEGLRILAKVKSDLGLPLLTDVHEADQAPAVAEVCDLLQIPAFLCRQTDFVAAVGRAGKPVNVKKGQFLAPWDVKNIAVKLEEVGCRDVLMTERGVSFGYGTLVSDMRALAIMREVTGLPVCFDATHSVQQPGALGNATGGQRQYVPTLARAASATGIHALFLETHDNPDAAKSDGPNMVPLHEFERLARTCRDLDRIARE